MSELPSGPIKLQLYDRSRKPSDWVGHLGASQYAVFLTHAKLGYELAEDGMPKPKSVPSYCLVFDGLVEAEAYCVEFVESKPNARCDVYDHHGKSRAPLASFTHPRHAARVLNRRSAYRMCLLAGALVVPTPLLFWIDWRVRGVLIVPTLVGLSLIMAAFRLLLWAFGTLDAVRKREQRHAGQKAAHLSD
jgi:hypothetical protein